MEYPDLKIENLGRHAAGFTRFRVTATKFGRAIECTPCASAKAMRELGDKVADYIIGKAEAVFDRAEDPGPFK